MGTLKGFYTGLTAAMLLVPPASAQVAEEPCADRHDSFDLTSLLLPALVGESYALRGYIRTCLHHSRFGRVPPDNTLRAEELHTVDRIYLFALRLADGDHLDALAICTLGTLTHKHIPFSFGLHVPLTTEGDSLYNERIARLPRLLYTDTGRYGDADKLQHFFGSAYATLAADGEAVPDALGLFVEWGESGFVKDERYDDRDVRSNRLGQLFAVRLHQTPSLLPSQVFREWNTLGDRLFEQR